MRKAFKGELKDTSGGFVGLIDLYNTTLAIRYKTTELCALNFKPVSDSRDSAERQKWEALSHNHAIDPFIQNAPFL